MDAAFLRKSDRVGPGIYSDFEGPRMVPLIASRPLWVINGDSDARAPMPGLGECLAAVEVADAGRSERVQVRIQPATAHKVNLESLTLAIDWFEKWLRPNPRSH